MAREKRKSRGYRRSSKSLPIAALIVAALVIGVGGGWALARYGGDGEEMIQIQLAPSSLLPEKVRKAPPVVQEAYRFAIANPQVLSKLPCYCGCGSMGHTSDLDCFIKRFDPDGSIVFGYHAFG